VMVDTAVKDGRPTFDFMSEADLEQFISRAMRQGCRWPSPGASDLPIWICCGFCSPI